MSYTINDTPISQWGMYARVINDSLRGYALSGAWSLTKRLGETHCNWEGDIEPYVLADDMHFDGRELTLRLACTASSTQERHERIKAFQRELPDQFTLSHQTLGTFEVGLTHLKVQHYGRKWGGLTLSLREPQPRFGSILPVPDGGVFGIDGNSWASLGFVVETLSGNDHLGNWQPLSVTTDPNTDVWRPGYREPNIVTVKGTIKGANYAQFKSHIEALQALLAAPGVRTINYFDGSTFIAFCVDGFEVEAYNFKPVHWGQFNCKMIVL